MFKIKKKRIHSSYRYKLYLIKDIKDLFFSTFITVYVFFEIKVIGCYASWNQFKDI